MKDAQAWWHVQERETAPDCVEMAVGVESEHAM